MCANKYARLKFGIGDTHMAQTKFLVVLMLGIVIQLSFPAAPVHNTASSAEHVINVNQADVANERKSNIHCDDDEQPASNTCCYCLTDSADTCLMDAECNSASSPLVLIPFNLPIKSIGYLQHPLSYEGNVKQMSFDIFYPPK